VDSLGIFVHQKMMDTKEQIVGYCVRFKKLGDLDKTVLAALISFAMK
jgi:hypothetical protein